MFRDDPALARTRDALAGIVAMLVSMVWLSDGKVARRIERAVRIQVLRILRPAEAAMRRLIYIAAQRIEAKPVAARPAVNFAALRQLQAKKPKRRSFQLSDPMVPMVAPAPRAMRALRVRWIPPIDPTIPALLATRAPSKQKSDIEDIRSASLICRLQAITSALDNIPHQAQRLIRWTARRERIAVQRPVYTSPLRAGPPPGYRKEPVHDIDRILAQCHLRAFDARMAKAKTDTS